MNEKPTCKSLVFYVNNFTQPLCRHHHHQSIQTYTEYGVASTISLRHCITNKQKMSVIFINLMLDLTYVNRLKVLEN